MGESDFVPMKFKIGLAADVRNKVYTMPRTLPMTNVDEAEVICLVLLSRLSMLP